jgi:20S proteasome alpha/beta subunit
VTIDRISETTVATVYEMRRRGSASSGSKQVAVIKAELRDMMGDFVAVFREVNSKQ